MLWLARNRRRFYFGQPFTAIEKTRVRTPCRRLVPQIKRELVRATLRQQSNRAALGIIVAFFRTVYGTRNRYIPITDHKRPTERYRDGPRARTSRTYFREAAGTHLRFNGLGNGPKCRSQSLYRVKPTATILALVSLPLAVSLIPGEHSHVQVILYER